MNTTRTSLYTAFLSIALAVASAGGQATVNRDRPRSSYDPAAASNLNAKQTGGVESALGTLNASNKDYACAIDTAHVAAIDETVNNVLWWTSVVFLMTTGFSFLYIYWLWDEREMRLDISAAIVAQLWNGHAFSHRKAHESIEMYNALMHRFNAQTVELWAAQKAAAVKQTKEAKKKRADSESSDKLNSPDEETLATVKTEQLNLLPPKEDVVPVQVVTNKTPSRREADVMDEMIEPDNEDEEEEQNEMKRLRAELQKATIVVSQMKAQAVAQDQKISNLRSNLNRAHDQYKGQPQQDGGR